MTRSQYIRSAVAVMVLLVAVSVVLNVIFSQVTVARWDLTQDGRYSLSPATQRILDGIDGGSIRIKAFLSRDLPAPDNALAQNLRDLLAEFEAHSHGRLSFEIIEPETPADEEIAKGFGMRRVAIAQKDETQRSLRLVFKGLTVIHRDTAETIPEIRSGDNVEYLIARCIVNLTAPAHKTVGILTGFGGLAESPILRDSMAEVFDEVFGKRVQVQAVRVDDKCRIAAQSDAIVVLGLREKLTECAQYAIEQAAFAGTAVVVLQSPSRPDYAQPDQPRIPLDTAIDAVLQNAGIRLDSTILLDRVHNLVGTQYTEDGILEISQPALPVLSDLDRTHPVTQNLSALAFPFSGTMTVDRERIQGQGGQITVLASSSPESVARPAGGDIGVDALQKPHPGERPGPFPMAVLVRTPQASRFVGRLPAQADPAAFLPATDDARYFVVPDDEFLFVNKITGYTDAFAKFGIHLFVNAIEWLIQDEALMEIRNRSLPQMVQIPDAATQSRILRIHVIGVPALVLVLMAALHWARKRRKERIRRRYQHD